MQINTVFFVGSNKYGQSGTGEKNNTTVFSIPKQYDFRVFIRQVSCGYHHSAILTLSGNVYTMGSNIHGTLGSRQQALNYSFSPILVEGLPTIHRIESGAFHLCALTQSGQIYSWGRGMDGQLGTGSNKNSYLPELVEADQPIIDFSCGTNHTIILGKSGFAYSFGNGIYGQLGTGNNKNQPRPKRIQLEGVTMVAAGDNHSLFLVGGKVFAAGDNTSGQIGIGASKKYVLQPQPLTLENVTMIQAAKFSVCVAGSQLYVWGGATKQYFPMLLPTEGSITQIKAGNETLLFLNSEGSFYSWSTANANSIVPLSISKVLDFSIGENHILILGDVSRITEDYQPQTHPPKVLRAYDCYNTGGAPVCQMVRTPLKQMPQRVLNQDKTPNDKQNQYPTQAEYGSVGPERHKLQLSESKSAIRKQNTTTPVRGRQTNNSSEGELRNRLELLIHETRKCKQEFESVKGLISQLKSISIDPQKNKCCLSTLDSNKQNSFIGENTLCSNESTSNTIRGVTEKSNILRLREKDLKISRLQQELSQKDALISMYESTITNMGRVLESQKEQIQLLERHLQ